jgi:hypothetical protein
MAAWGRWRPRHDELGAHNRGLGVQEEETRSKSIDLHDMLEETGQRAEGAARSSSQGGRKG